MGCQTFLKYILKCVKKELKLFTEIVVTLLRTVSVLRPGEPGHLLGLRPNIFAIFYVNPPEFLI